jgi:Flp pilus assembly protein TadG
MRTPRETDLRADRPRAAAAVELALILPLFLLLVLGCIDFGRFAYTFIAVTNAARAGAGVGVMSQYPDPVAGTGQGLANWQRSVCNAVADELGMTEDFSPSGSGGSNGYVNSQGLYVNATRFAESGGLWRAQVTARYPFVWWTFAGNALPQQTVVLRAIR